MAGRRVAIAIAVAACVCMTVAAAAATTAATSTTITVPGSSVVARTRIANSYATPGDWTAVAKAPKEHVLTFTVAVSHGDATAIEQTCEAVSAPRSARYGQHLSAAELAELSGGAANAGAVAAWFVAAGATQVETVATKDFVVVSMPVAAAEAAFGVAFHVYQHAKVSSLRVVRADAHYELPTALLGKVDVIAGLVDFPPVKLQKAATTPVAEPATAMTAGYTVPPSVGLLLPYVNSTGGFVQLFVYCTNSTLANTTVPCQKDVDPVKTIELQVQINGGAPQVYSVAANELEFITVSSGFGGFPAYQTNFPFSFKEFDGVNVTVRLQTKSGYTSYWSGCPWMNITTNLMRVKATPFVTPELLYEVYGLQEPAQMAVARNNSQAVAEFGLQFYAPSDLAAFFSKYDVQNPADVTLIGPNIPEMPGGEAQLDIQWIMAVNPHAPTDFWSIKMMNSSNLDGSFILEWAMQVSNATSPPLVHSISYGMPEALYAQQFPAGYIQRANLEFAKLCTRGITVVIASGDAGSTNDGHGTNDCVITPNFPSSSPYIVSVSATFLDNSTPRAGTKYGESAVSIPNGMFWTTGGGFSNAFKQPSYQKAAVQSYLSSAAKSLPTGQFNASGRAYPDVSAIGHNLLVEMYDIPTPTDGTSASAPIFAGIVSRLNNARLLAGKSSVGFLNPVLYDVYAQEPVAFYDVIGGNNACGGFLCCPSGFPVVKGYDSVTGLGTLGSYSHLEAFIMSLP